MKHLQPSKDKLRQKFKERRLKMSDAERTVKSRAVTGRLQDVLDWSKVKTVHYFEPIRELMEVDISDFVTWLEDNCPDIQLFTPRKIGSEWEMISIKDHPAPEQFDVVIVPMLGFDPKTLHRIGYGGGYYDKFLATQPQDKKIGICFENGRVDMIPNEDFDIPLNLIVTEEKTYSS
jgi:5-formyltetrahydrofolate cyclo-ligase